MGAPLPEGWDVEEPDDNQSGPVQRFDLPLARWCRSCSRGSAALRPLCRYTLRDAGPGDLVYIDSPHHPRSATSRFTADTAGAFGDRDQAESPRSRATSRRTADPAC